MTLFFDPAGPMIVYEKYILFIEDLNPEHRIRWRLSRFEALKIGLRFIVASVRM